MPPELQQLYIPAASALFGALLGALASIVTTYLSSRHQARLEETRAQREDRRQRDAWRREDQARFHLYRRELYARFLSSVSRALQTSSVISSTGDSPLAQLLPEFSQQKEAHLKAFDDIVMMWEEINLVGSTEVVAAANAINDATAQARFQAVAGERGIAEIVTALGDREPLQEYVKVHRPRFLRAARSELGLPELQFPEPEDSE